MPQTARVVGTATDPHRKTVKLETKDVARFLWEALGSKLTAYIAGVSDTKMVRQWANGDSNPSATREKRLRAAYQVFQELLQHEDAFVARAWFIGMNPQLDDESPADFLRDDRAKEVLNAARTFSSGA